MTEFLPKNPNFEEVVRGSFSRQPFMDHVGASLTKLKPGFCEIEVAHQKALTQQHGFFHGGVVASLADSAAGYAAYSLFPENSTVLTVDLKVNYLNPSDGEKLIARASVIRFGKKLCHLKGDVFAVRGDTEIHCLTGLFTMMCLMGKPDSGLAVGPGSIG